MNEGRGHDVVSGWRKDRHDTFVNRKLPSMIANWLIGYVTGVRLHDYGCTLKAYRREIIRDVNLYSELHRFLPALAAWNGARVAEIPVNHRPRTRGLTKYGIGRTFKVLLDLLTVKFLGSYMNKPLYFFGKLAFYALVVAAAVLGVAIGQKYGWFGQEALHLNRNILVTLSVLMAILSAQCLVVGVMAELLVRIYHESQGRPTYRIRNVYRVKTAVAEK
jgi:glycosyltransferase involved in cell wall biosynthesis